MKLYQKFATTTNAIENCRESGNDEWYDNHVETLNELIDLLPHGSGIDSDWNFNEDRSSEQKVVLHCAYHRMDEYGYQGWIDFTVTVVPCLMFGCNVRVTGNFGKYQDIKDYLIEIMAGAFVSEYTS